MKIVENYPNRIYCFTVALIAFFTLNMRAQSSKPQSEVSRRYFEPSIEDRFNFRFTLSTYCLFQGGWGVSIAAGSWVDSHGFQPALNTSINAYFSGRNLGNARFYGERTMVMGKGNPNRMMVNIVFSPLLIAHLDRKRSYYDEVNPFYFGSSSMIYNNYHNAIALGTSFVTMPRGTYNNIMTGRNRTQQLIYFHLKIDAVQLNMYEDYFAFTSYGAFMWLCDNRDRYYTGGGNLQVKLGNLYKLKIYSEMYTGNSYIDKQEHPDIAFPEQVPHQMKLSKGNAINKKYAFQDPGQQSFNKARNFVCIEYNASAKLAKKNPDEDFYRDYNNYVMLIFGRQGGMQNMLQQNFIHNSISIDKDNKYQSGSSTLHQFDYRDNFFPETFVGVQTSISY